MRNQFYFVPTGELRRPVEGEYYRNMPFDEIHLAKSDVMAERPIYRRIDFALVLGLVSACEQAILSNSGEEFCGYPELQAALAAAREAGITGEAK